MKYQTIQSTCPLCDENTEHDQLDNYADYTLVLCHKCKLISKIISNLNRSKIQNLQNYVYDDLDERTAHNINTRMADERLRLISKFVNKGNVLEIGCATGEFIQEAQKSGFNALGIDASKMYTDYAQKKGINVRHGYLEDFKFDHSFDIVALFHLIEHIENPKNFLKKIYPLTSDSGMLYIITPNADGLLDKIFGYRHPLYIQPDHLLFFSKETLSRLLTEVGFNVLKVLTREVPYNFFGAMRGYLAAILKRKNKPTKIKSQINSKRKSFIKKAIEVSPFIMGNMFYPILKPLAMLAERQGRGHELIIIAQKSNLK
jgi:2-polyprenyl-3-methyl-5-hydroxy-6-metoxy-1,4-benzoquinol methylase